MSYKLFASHHIKGLIDQGEHQQLDFKFCISDSRKIARSLVAFSNTDGGKLLIGVKDNGSIAGVRSDEEYYMVEGAAELYSKPPVKFEVQEWNIEGKTVLEVTVSKSEKKPHYAQEENGKWMVYIRVDDQNLLANNVLLKVWRRQKSKKGVYVRYTNIEKLLFEYLKQSNTITFGRFCKIAGITRSRAENILVNMILLDIIDIEFTENGTYYRIKENQKTSEKDSNKRNKR